MDQFRNLLPMLVTLGAALAGAILALKLRVKAGALVGALFAVSILSIATGLAFMPNEAKILAQLIAGSVVGASVSRENIREFKRMLIPSVAFLIMMILIGLFLGFSLFAIYHMDWLTAMFTTVPGGMTEMSIISLEMGADVSIVILFQLVRLFSMILLTPVLIPRIAARLSDYEIKTGSDHLSYTLSSLPQNTVKATPTSYGKLIAVLVLSWLMGCFGYAMEFPGGALTFSMMTMILFNVKFGIGAMPPKLKKAAQILSGAYIGCQVTYAVFQQIPRLLIPMAFMTIGFFVLSLSAGYLIHRVFHMDLLTALFSSVPAGASDMALISLEYDAAGSQVALFHTVRMIGVIAFVPPIIRLLSR